MTTKYDSKEQALEIGLVYTGYSTPELRKKVRDSLPEPVQRQLGWPQNKTIEVYRLKNPEGKEVELGVGEFREGFDLWLIIPETGFSHRT